MPLSNGDPIGPPIRPGPGTGATAPIGANPATAGTILPTDTEAGQRWRANAPPSDIAQAGGYYGGNDPNQENTLRGSWMAGRIGGSMGAENNELNRTDWGLQRASDLQNTGQGIQNTFSNIGQGYTGMGNDATAGAAGFRQSAAGNYGQQIDARQQAIEGLNSMKQFYAQGPTPSVAQAQMSQAADRNLGAAFAASQAGRGAGDNAAAARGAMGAGAANLGAAGAQFAGQRAQEASGWRGQQLSGMGAMQTGYGNMRGGDINAMNQNVSTANDYNKLGLDYGTLGMKTRGQGVENAQGYAKMGEGAAENSEQLRQNILLQQQQNDVALQNASRIADLNNLKTDQQKNAATMGAVGTGIGAGVGFVAGGPVGAAAGAGVGGEAGSKMSDVRGKKNVTPMYSDVRGKTNIIPMPENYGVKY